MEGASASKFEATCFETNGDERLLLATIVGDLAIAMAFIFNFTTLHAVKIQDVMLVVLFVAVAISASHFNAKIAVSIFVMNVKMKT